MNTEIEINQKQKIIKQKKQNIAYLKQLSSKLDVVEDNLEKIQAI